VDGSLTDLREIEILRQDLNRVGPIADAVGGWLPHGGEIPSFRYFFADEAEFANVPLGYVGYSDAVLSADTASATTATIDNVSYYNSARFMQLDATGTKLVALSNHVFFFTGRAEFDASATGDRRVTFSAYGVDDALLYTKDLVCVKSATQKTIIPFNGAYPLTTGQYLMFSIWQNSGGTLATNAFYVRLFIIK
jgi:hypothetical protein